MNNNSISIEKNNRGSIQAQARCLMNQNRHRQHNRRLAMLNRTASELGTTI